MLGSWRLLKVLKGMDKCVHWVWDCSLQTLALSLLALGTDIETECPGCRDGSVVKALAFLPEDPGSILSIRTVFGSPR